MTRSVVDKSCTEVRVKFLARGRPIQRNPYRNCMVRIRVA